MTALVIQMLEDTLEKARTVGFTSIAISVTSVNGNYYNWSAGEEEQQLQLLSSLTDRFRAHVDNWRPPEGDSSLDESYACYHCNFVPDGFDFLTWLLTQEMYRIDCEAPAPLKVAFWRGRHPHQPNPWLDAVYRPLVKMIGGVEDDKAFGRMGASVHVTRTLAAMHRIGGKLPQLQSVGKYDFPRNAITITLRECDQFPHRNSDLITWYEFSRILKARGERVLFVRDTSRANEPLSGCETVPLASIDLDARMWLYENSKLNFFVSNGPMMLAALTDRIPYITFVMPEEMDSKYDSNKPHFWKLKMGVEQGQQFPWARPHQKIVWQKPTFDALDTAYRRWRNDNPIFLSAAE